MPSGAKAGFMGVTNSPPIGGRLGRRRGRHPAPVPAGHARERLATVLDEVSETRARCSRTRTHGLQRPSYGERERTARFSLPRSPATSLASC